MSRSLNLKQPQLSAWHQAVANAIGKGYSDSAIDLLVNELENLVSGSGCALIVYPKGIQPFWPFHHLLPNQDPAVHIDQYVQGAYLIDPYYRHAKDQHAEGVFTIADIAPRGFKKSEFYKVYYRLVDLTDEACLIVQAPEECIILISISRHANEPRFSTREKAVLESTFPLVREIILQWWKTTQTTNLLESHLDMALEHFGSSLLTPREKQIVQLFLRGYALKVIAQKLDISPETIKHHRKSIYTKLDIGSQSEMFYLFIDSLRMVTVDSPADPLVKYLAPAES